MYKNHEYYINQPEAVTLLATGTFFGHQNYYYEAAAFLELQVSRVRTSGCGTVENTLSHVREPGYVLLIPIHP